MQAIESCFSRLQECDFLRLLLPKVVLCDLLDDLFLEVAVKSAVTRDLFRLNVLLARQKLNLVLFNHLQ